MDETWVGGQHIFDRAKAAIGQPESTDGTILLWVRSGYLEKDGTEPLFLDGRGGALMSAMVGSNEQ